MQRDIHETAVPLLSQNNLNYGDNFNVRVVRKQCI